MPGLTGQQPLVLNALMIVDSLRACPVCVATAKIATCNLCCAGGRNMVGHGIKKYLSCSQTQSLLHLAKNIFVGVWLVTWLVSVTQVTDCWSNDNLYLLSPHTQKGGPAHTPSCTAIHQWHSLPRNCCFICWTLWQQLASCFWLQAGTQPYYIQLSSIVCLCTHLGYWVSSGLMNLSMGTTRDSITRWVSINMYLWGLSACLGGTLVLLILGTY